MTVLTQMANGDWGVYEPIDTTMFGSVTIEKYDAITGQTAQGDATLKGATYKLINSSTNPVAVYGTVFVPGEVICYLTSYETSVVQSKNILPPGQYTIFEESPPEGYLLNKEWRKTFSVTTEEKDHFFTYDKGNGCADDVIAGQIQIAKRIVNPLDDASAPETGAKFTITNSRGDVVDSIVTGENGIGISGILPYGTYTVQQVSGQIGTVFCDAWMVTVSEHGTIYAYEVNNPLWTASVSIHKQDMNQNPLIATFELCERLENGTVRVLEIGATNGYGNLTFIQKIAYTDGICNKSTYFIREKEAPAGYMLNTMEHPVFCCENNQEIFLTLENVPVLGKLEIRKKSSADRPMEGVEFLLEYSLDNGSTWNAVTYRASNLAILPGSCTSDRLTNGKLLTDSDGIVVYEGLRVYTTDGRTILYRATETKTLNGSSLMPGHIWEGELVTEKEGEHQFEVVLGVVNSPILELPETGSKSLALMPMGLLLCAAVCMGALFVLKKKKEV
jgi:LPXTG-motif cell wall-anchored protein